MDKVYVTRNWHELSTWNSLSSGISAGGDFDGVPVVTFEGDNDPDGYHVRHIDVLDAVQRWANGEANYGFGIVSETIGGNDDDIDLFSSEASQIMFRPALEVEFTLV